MMLSEIKEKLNSISCDQNVIAEDEDGNEYDFKLSTVGNSELCIDLSIKLDQYKIENEYGTFYDTDSIAGIFLLKEIIMVGCSDNNADLFVNCSDVFCPGFAEGESINRNEIAELYEMYIKDKDYGCVKWVCKKRNTKPHPAVIERMKNDGSWDDWMDNLK